MDPQATLLSFFSQEIQSHSTILFGFVAAFFTFFQSGAHKVLRSEKNGRKFFMAFVLMSMLAGLTYTIGRIMAYGQFAEYTIQSTPSANVSLGDYYREVAAAAYSFGASRLVLPFFYGIYAAGTALSIWFGGFVVMLTLMILGGHKDQGQRNWPDILRVVLSFVLIGMILDVNSYVQASVPANAWKDYDNLILDAVTTVWTTLICWPFSWHWRKLAQIASHLKEVLGPSGRAIDKSRTRASAFLHSSSWIGI